METQYYTLTVTKSLNFSLIKFNLISWF